MNILSIETSCDETAIAIVRGEFVAENHAEFTILGNVIHSQIEQHREFGGVYPNVARREHSAHICDLLRIVLTESGMDGQESLAAFTAAQTDLITTFLDRDPALLGTLSQLAWIYRNEIVGRVDAIAVTTGPGLAPALWVGINVARSLAVLWDVPLVAVNHMAGHVLSGLFPNNKLRLPALSLLVSGGHTEIQLVTSPTSFTLLGSTVDDAAGEAFDKVGRMLGLPYPAGPEVAKIATTHRTNYPDYQSNYQLPLPMQYSGNLNFSFSGLKTAVKRIVDNESNHSTDFIAQMCREFEDAVVNILVLKLDDAIKDHQPKQLLIGGGVIANTYLQQRLKNLANTYALEIQIPTSNLCGDNALMIALAGWWQARHKDYINPLNITAISNWKLSAPCYHDKKLLP